MAHDHIIYDADPHFTIDAITRVITNQSSSKTMIMQNDHNSERFSFKMPKEVESHDMTQCNRVQVHYINIGTNARNIGVYEITDMHVDPDDENSIVCSWLISRNATQLVGTLNFIIRFACVNGDETDYVWNTAVHSGITISAGIDNSDAVVEDYADVLEQWYNELTSAGTASLGGISEAKTAAITDVNSAKDNAVESVNSTKDNAVKSVNSTKDNAVKSVNSAWEQAVQSIDAREKAVLKNIGDAGGVVSSETEPTNENVSVWIKESDEPQTARLLDESDIDAIKAKLNVELASTLKDNEEDKAPSVKAVNDGLGGKLSRFKTKPTTYALYGMSTTGADLQVLIDAKNVNQRVPMYSESEEHGKTDRKGFINTTTPTQPYHCANKKYVDDMRLELELDQRTYKLTAALVGGDGWYLGDPVTIDLPIEEMIVNMEVDETGDNVILNLRNGETLSVPLEKLGRGFVPYAPPNSFSDWAESDYAKDYDGDGVIDAADLNRFLLNYRHIIDVSDPLLPQNATNKKYVDTGLAGKLDAVTKSGKWVYTTEDGVQVTRRVGTNPTSWCIPWFDENGNLKSSTPVADIDAANKKYVDDNLAPIIAELGAMVLTKEDRMTAPLEIPFMLPAGVKSNIYIVSASCEKTWSNIATGETKVTSAKPTTLSTINMATGVRCEVVPFEEGGFFKLEDGENALTISLYDAVYPDPPDDSGNWEQETLDPVFSLEIIYQVKVGG